MALAGEIESGSHVTTGRKHAARVPEKRARLEATATASFFSTVEISIFIICGYFRKLRQLKISLLNKRIRKRIFMKYFDLKQTSERFKEICIVRQFCFSAYVS